MLPGGHRVHWGRGLSLQDGGTAGASDRGANETKITDVDSIFLGGKAMQVN